ncbi:hypothetical protein GPY51_18710 [Photorhabdus laumondii subsp. laumondii]|uniref:Uncharacterized protein n=1 Tax=Photorhabdus laumondii subsp. laumondii TaxID=141679 RepID=A0A6L9JVP2_PHOLM|nr:MULTISPECIES: hypothetical protein [Photorhabdus]MCC8384667.1 hypothetical protein [Photorhabdus laumondii]MCC8413362.1 hypothetical protein [Photorhabdus laumondii]NDK96269.1 hypothetical protein [Photorhabdus laumondii subsp. laumondii]NDL22523.1 hypothetical protein [Photorhabdus laumondii subsp. laumondii]NDL40732.1 hypothetical protein [Photorhabdus laumondii subsp. laumondii]
MTTERYSVSQASLHAENWCKKHPAWISICDMPDGYCDTLYVQWNSLGRRHPCL